MKRIIVLTQSATEAEVSYQILFWFSITAGAKPQTSGSLWVPSGTSAGASATENTAIQNGTVLEELHSFSFPVSTPVVDIENVLLQAWTNRNVQINGIGPNQFYGAFNDSATGWGTA